MQVDQKFAITTILSLILLSMIGLSTRLVYLKGFYIKPAESLTLPEENRSAMDNTEENGYPILSLDLTSTPAQTQKIMFFLLLVPVGLLITALAVSVLGIRTIGTFSPTLLALSQARSDWRVGTIIFIITFGLGSLCRMLLMRFKISTVSRRGVIGTLVVSSLVIIISLSHRYGLAPTTRHVLLPVAVMTVMIDRFFTIIQTEGNKKALKVLANSVAIAIFCFVVFAYTPAGEILLNFPELVLLIMALLIIVGRYSGRPLLDAICIQNNGSLDQKGTE